MPSCSRSLGLLGLTVSLLFSPACTRGPTPAEGGSTISGKVSYNGQPVAYGFVLFYDMKEGLDEKTMTVSPAGMGKITAGSYEATNVPAGTLMVCVACDPELPLHEILGPRSLGGPIDPKGFGPPMPGVPGGPFGKQGGDKGGQVFDPRKPPPKEGQGAPPLPRVLLPEVEQLTVEQRQTLKNIHAKYGEVGRSPLPPLEVQDGVDVPYDIRLK
jgi:hypothetical protein